MTWLSDEALWTSVAESLRRVILPELTEGHARLTAIQLAALADHARTRGANPVADRMVELADALGFTQRDGTALARSASLLATAAAGAAASDAAAAAHVRAVLVRHLDDDLAATAGLGEAFRGLPPA